MKKLFITLLFCASIFLMFNIDVQAGCCQNSDCTGQSASCSGNTNNNCTPGKNDGTGTCKVTDAAATCNWAGVSCIGPQSDGKCYETTTACTPAGTKQTRQCTCAGGGGGNDNGGGGTDNGGGGNDNGGGGNDNGGAGETAAPAAPACTAPTFVKASVAPSTVRPYDQVYVSCDYGKKLDCVTVEGAGLTGCVHSRYDGTANVFTCAAGTEGGYFDDTKCVISAGTGDKCCAGSNKVGSLNVIGAEVRYDQDVVLPFGTYTFEAKVYSVLAKNTGNKVSLICNSDTCANSKKKGEEVTSMTFAAGTDFATQTKTVTLTGSGDDRHYLVRVSSGRGSEAYFDTVSLKNKAGKELIINGEFSSTASTSILIQQPNSWGEGDNKAGYYYGSMSGDQFTQSLNIVSQPVYPTSVPAGSTTTPTTPGAITPTPGKASAVSLTLKIKLQGVIKKPVKADPITVQVKLAGTNLTAALTKSVQFTVGDTGEWTGKADFDGVPTGGGYMVYIKGPKHVQKKVCGMSPTETKGGTYRCSDGAIVLQAGANTLDFTKIIQMGGDLPEAGGKQNGIIDAYDTTFIRTNLGTTDAAKIAIGDLNYDGGIDSQDYSMILQSLSIKFDEE
ncbi:MAG: hypothetical protein NTZ55_01590 [Candidatus Roizmanbacteria bacterium]|nr:hypothetical protein [Candidatus Roizmanbacteria bacterium]